MGQGDYEKEIASQRKAAYAKPKIAEKLLINPNQLASDLRTLSHDSLQGRLPGTKGSEMARAFIVRRLNELKVEPALSNFTQQFPLSVHGKPVSGSNIAGIIRGKQHPETYIVLSAHYDHLGIKNNKIYNGADDDASGVCAVLAIAEYFSVHKPERSILLTFFDAEEEGLRGSSYFVENPPVKLTDIVMNINLDMVSRNDKHDELIAVGTSYNPEFRKLLEPLQSKSNVALIFGYDRPSMSEIEDWTMSSDHGPFHRHKIPFLYFGVIDHKDYHGPGDDFDKIDQKFYASAVNLILNSALLLDNAK